MKIEIENYMVDENGEWKCGIFVGAKFRWTLQAVAVKLLFLLVILIHL